MTADNTAKEQRGRPFQPGESGNPSGRPKGARNKLSETFLETLLDDFVANGEHAIEALRKSDPKAYLHIIATVTAKVPLAEINVNSNTQVNNNRVMFVTDHGTDEEWEAKLQAQQSALVTDASKQPTGEPSET